MWISTKARNNTTHINREATSNGPVPGAMVVPYNAAASANQAVWFFFWLWAYNTSVIAQPICLERYIDALNRFRAYRPQYFVPLIVFGIFLNITATYGCVLPTMTEVYSLGELLPLCACYALTLCSLVRRMLDVFFVGFGIAFAVHFLFLPLTSRDLVTLTLNEYLHHLKTLLDSQQDLVNSIPARDWDSRETTGSSDGDLDIATGTAKRRTDWPEADAWRSATAAATESQIKVSSELRYVKREFVRSKLRASDFACISKLLSNILVPTLGMETVAQLVDRVERLGGWAAIKSGTTPEAATHGRIVQSEEEEWKLLFDQFRASTSQLWQAMLEGLDFAFFTLQITRKPAFFTKDELNAKVLGSATDGKSFAAYLENSIQAFLKGREGPIRDWCRAFGREDVPGATSKNPLHERYLSQLYLVLNVSLQSCCML